MDRFERDGLTFEVSDDGPATGRAVIALHGFPEDRHCWDDLTAILTEAGHRVIAPDQRGYSPGARPRGRRSYSIGALSHDVLALADAAGVDRFDLLGHDWGAVVAWDLAARSPARVRTLTSLAVPHPAAMLAATVRSTQILRSYYMLLFQVPLLPEAAMRAAGADRVTRRLVADGLDEPTARRYAGRMTDPAALRGPLNWYRALPFAGRSPTPAVSVPALYVWGERDSYIGRRAAELTARHVRGPYRFEALPGASHWLPTSEASRVGPLLLEHLAAHPG